MEPIAPAVAPALPDVESADRARLAGETPLTGLRIGLGLDLDAACREATAWTRAELLALAMARGCQFYAGLWPVLPDIRGDLPHEVLGCALLRGPADVETFQAIRCATMVLSDLYNDPGMIGEVAVRLDVAGRLAHLAQLGRRHDTGPSYWSAVLAGLPTGTAVEDFLPGVSRLTCETMELTPGRRLKRKWLRTEYVR
jgi:hypothetical protein